MFHPVYSSKLDSYSRLLNIDETGKVFRRLNIDGIFFID